jgi:predicted Fe-Mo cluster-binding NifX family protein
MTRILIPLEDENGLDSHVAEHFGRAPYFAVIEVDNGKVTSTKILPNTTEHFGGTGHPHDTLLALNPHVIIAHAMGAGALMSFHKAKVLVLKANGNHVDEVVEAFTQGKLSELTSVCPHGHNHEH